MLTHTKLFPAAGMGIPSGDSQRGVAEVTATLGTRLGRGPLLIGDRYTTLELLISRIFAWAPEAIPDVRVISDWISRCQARPSALDAVRMAGLGGTVPKRVFSLCFSRVWQPLPPALNAPSAP